MIFEVQELNNITAHCHIDLSYLREFSNGDKAFEKDMLITSIEETEEKINLLQAYISTNQPDKIKHLAHSIKSLMSVMGLTHLYHYFYKIEYANFPHGITHTWLNQLQLSQPLWSQAKATMADTIAIAYE